MIVYCKDCEFWVTSEQCHRYSPVVMRVETPEAKKITLHQVSSHLVTRWSETLSGEGCGEFQPK